jgi:polyhydroxybutyrate depolymerase
MAWSGKRHALALAVSVATVGAVAALAIALPDGSATTPARASSPGSSVAAQARAIVPAGRARQATPPLRPCTRRPAGMQIATAGHRSFLLYVPKGLEPNRRVPTMLLLHGTGGNGAKQLAASGLKATADKEKFLIAAPNGAIAYRKGYAWHVPGVSLLGGYRAPKDAPDDVAFLRTVADTTDRNWCGDPKRTYASGFSGGARMASALACVAADRFAAVAPVSGLRAGTPGRAGPDQRSCLPSRPVGIVAVHGTTDRTNPFDGGGGAYWRYGDAAALRRWAVLDGCRIADPPETLSRRGTVLRSTGCRTNAGVELLRIAKGRHEWPRPGSRSDPGFDVNRFLWTELSRYVR